MSLPFAYTRDARMSPRPGQFPALERKQEPLFRTPSVNLRRAKKQYNLQKYVIETRRDRLPSSAVVGELIQPHSTNAYSTPHFLEETEQKVNSNAVAPKAHQTASIYLIKNVPSFIQVEVGHDDSGLRRWHVNLEDREDFRCDTEVEKTQFFLEL